MPGQFRASFIFLIAAMTNNTLQNALILLFAAIACFLGFYIYSTSGPPADTDPQPSGSFSRTEAQFRDKLTALNIDKNKVVNSVKRLDAIKKEVVADLRSKGIKSGADYFKTEDQADPCWRKLNGNESVSRPL